MIRHLAIAAFLLASPALVQASAEVDKAAPTFELKDTHGKTVKLADVVKEKTVVLEWLNYDCPFVKKHYDTKNMQKLQETYTAKGVAWFSIISSAKGKQGSFPAKKVNELSQQKGAHPTAILLDTEGKVGKLYDAKVTPHMFVIRKGGELAYAGGIDDKATTDAEDVPTATNFVAKALDETLEGKPVTKKTSTPYGCAVKY
jgi:peroxiredoxin